jgi:hypothetical protein
MIVRGPITLRMPSKKFVSLVISLILTASLFGGIAGCSSGSELTPILPAVSATLPPPLATASPVPTTPPGRVILVAPTGINLQNVNNVEALLKELVGPVMAVNVVQGLTSGEITPEVKVVVTLIPLENLPELIGAAPHVQFVTFSTVDLGAAPNLSVIRQQPERQAFIAGYLSVIITNDWRVTGFLPVEEPLGTIVNDAFVNGAAHYCGICNSRSAPIVKFPLTQRISINSDPSGWQPVVEGLRPYDVKVIYVAPEVAHDDFLRLIAGQSFILTGGKKPPEDVLSRWAGTIREDILSPLKAIWPGVSAGQGGKTVNSVLELSDINRQFLSEGRQRMIEETIKGLEVGAIYPLSLPLQ